MNVAQAEFGQIGVILSPTLTPRAPVSTHIACL